MLKLTLEETGVLTVCDIQTLNLDDDENVRYPVHILPFIEKSRI